MSKEQLTTQESQPDSESAGRAEDQTHGLRADLYAQIMRMSPGDVGVLAEMMVNYPSFMGAILMVAAPHIGNAAVQRAIALVKQQKATKGRGGSMNQDAVHEAMREPADSRPLSGAEMLESLHDKSDDPSGPSPATPPKSPSAPEPAWIAAARAYNANHPGLVAEFNDLTNDMCKSDDGNELDPKAVARWQTAHHLDADGKVGRHTVATARKASARGEPALDATDARPPV